MALFCLSHILVTISFSCIGLHVGFAKAAETLEVFVPDGPVYVRNGDDLTINISYQYSGTGNAQITWQRTDSTTALVIREKDGTIAKNDDRATIINDGDLVLNNATLVDNTTYKVTIQIAFSNVVKTTQVIVLEKPVANFTCLSKPLNETKNFSCLCTTSGGSPPPSVVWLKNDKAITSEGFLQQTLTITNASKNDTGNYTCNATSHTLSDKKDITILVKWKPKITVSCNWTDSTNTVNETEGISCKCQSEDGIPKPKVFWLRKDDGSVVSSRRDLSNTLEQTMTKQNKGVYICRAETSYPDTTVWFTEYELKIDVNHAPEITSFKADDNLPAYINTTVNLTCKADTFPLANFTLTRNGTVLHKTIETSNLTYVINQIGSPNMGEYLCVAENPFGSQNKSLNVTMTDVKPTTLPTTVTDADTTLSSTPTEGTTTTPTKMSTGAIVGIAVGSVFAVALFFAILWLLCCKKGKEKQSETIVNPSAAVYKPSMMENPYESPDHMMGDGDTADGQDSAGSSRPSTTGANPAPQAGGLPPVYAVVDKSRVTHNKKPEVDPSQVTYASLDAVALQPDSSRMHERPQVESNYASIDLRKL